MKTLSDKNFDQQLQSGYPMVVMFYADFSGPCRLAMPEFEEAASRRGNTVDFFVFDLDGNTKIPERYGVKGVPEFMLFSDGVPHNPVVGAIDCDTILDYVDTELGQ